MRLPNDQQRIAILGRTGSGKTFAEGWHLSQKNLEVKPWIIYDFKFDSFINDIDRAEEVDLDFVPSKKHHGLFIVHPLPTEAEEVETQMWKLWERGNVGVSIDEGYMVDNDAYKALLTQGRSKKIPMIVLSQRPCWLSRFVFSEADFYQVFNLNDVRDRKTVANFTPLGNNWRLEEFHSYYYDVGKNKLSHLSPVPNKDVLLETIDSKLKPRKTRFV